jgi:hypothetical protein
MLRRNVIITVAALATCALPASTAMAEPMSADHGTGDYAHGPLPPSAEKAQQPMSADHGVVTAAPAQGHLSADGADAAQARGIYETDRTPNTLDRPAGGNADTADNGRDLPPVQVPAPTVIRDAPSSGFDWGDAGIGAAGMLALFSIAAGSALLLGGRRRRRGVRVATH